MDNPREMVGASIIHWRRRFVGIAVFAAVMATVNIAQSPSTVRAREVDDRLSPQLSGSSPGLRQQSLTLSGLTPQGPERKLAEFEQRGVGCLVQLRFNLNPSAQTPAHCVLEITPESTTQGLQVRVVPEGDCSGVTGESNMRFNGDGSSVDRKVAFAYRWVDSRIVAYDTIHFPMFIVSAQINWVYDYADVYNGSFTPFNWYDDWWFEQFRSTGS